MSTPAAIVFFDFPAALGWARIARDGSLADFDFDTELAETVATLRENARVGLLAAGSLWTRARIREFLIRDGLVHQFDPDLTFHAPLAFPTRFALAVAASGVEASRCAFVSPNRNERSQAAAAGMLTTPHALLAPALLAGDRSVVIRIRGDRLILQALLQQVPRPAIIPFLREQHPEPALFALASGAAARALTQAGADIIEVAEGEVLAESDLYLIRPGPTDPQTTATFAARVRSAATFIHQEGESWIVGLPPECDADDLHPPAAQHGHTIWLQPSRTLDATPCATSTFATRPLSNDEAADLANLDAALVGSYLTPWFGGPIQSRHAYHPDNRTAALGMYAAFEAILGPHATVATEFVHHGYNLLNVSAEIVGTERPDEILIVGAHLDSTAMLTPAFAAATSNAPGADDDASGVAGVLAVAHVLAAMAAKQAPRRTLRFVLFNAEEVFMGGSFDYARRLKKDPSLHLLGMLQLDMIGYIGSSASPRPFELHTVGSADFGGLDPSVVLGSQALAHIVATAAGHVSPDLTPQRYPLADCNSDPAHARSDHRQFLARNWPACLVTEDMFTEIACGSQQGNPHYHTENDLHVDTAYAADIARAVAAAVWMMANG